MSDLSSLVRPVEMRKTDQCFFFVRVVDQG